MTKEQCGCPRPEHKDPKSFHKKDLCERCLAGNTCTWSKYRDIASIDDEEEDFYDNDQDDDYYNGYEEDNKYYEEDYNDDEDDRDFNDDEDDRAYEAWLQKFEEDFDI
ncbi:hypothetical protein BgiMline_013655 [Biomphalaria glabrata]|nr:hypothetical protein BgiMline_012479 [Biomphalaria glabrata]